MLLELDAEIGYTRHSTLQRVRLSVHPGETVLVRGPNGVGKSTLLSVAAGIRDPLRGKALVASLRATSARAKRHIGYATDPPSLFEELTPAEHIELASAMWQAAKVPVAGARLSGSLLDAVPALPCGMLSLGQRKRVGLALAVIHAPELWVFDEPFNGLDASSAQCLSDGIERHVRDGGAVLCATHDERLLGETSPTAVQLAMPSMPSSWSSAIDSV